MSYINHISNPRVFLLKIMQLIYGHKCNRYKKLILVGEPSQINFSNLTLENTTSQPKIKFPKIYCFKKICRKFRKNKNFEKT